MRYLHTALDIWKNCLPDFPPACPICGAHEWHESNIEGLEFKNRGVFAIVVCRVCRTAQFVKSAYGEG